MEHKLSSINSWWAVFVTNYVHQNYLGNFLNIQIPMTPLKPAESEFLRVSFRNMNFKKLLKSFLGMPKLQNGLD